MKTKVYILANPNTLKIRYVGITKMSLSKRLGGHKYDSVNRNKNSHRDNWIRSIYNTYKKPIIRQIAEFSTREEARELELKLIKKYKLKHNLVNVYDEGKFTKTGVKSARVYFTKPVYLYDEQGNFLKEFKSSTECAKYLKVKLITIEKVLYRKKKYGRNIKYKFQLTRVKYIKISPLLDISSKTKTQPPSEAIH